MAQAEIGALRVTLGLNAGEFTRGLTKSEMRLGKFQKRASSAANSAGKALVGLSVAGTAALAALSVAVKSTINDADRLAKLSQSVGVPIEQLSRLKFAADLSGTSLEQLANGVGRLSRNMADLAAGSGEEARRAFEALGITVKNADGTLRSSTEVMGEVADRFDRMEDGATKTAFAMQIFGRAGKDMIPLLNQGSAGIAEMTREADELGLTIDGKTGAAAEAFNDNLTRLNAVMRGVVTQVAAKMLPHLQQLSAVLVVVAKDGKLLETVANTLASGMRFVAVETAKAALFFTRARAEIAALGDALKLFMSGEFSQGFKVITDATAETDAAFAKLEEVLNKTVANTAAPMEEFGQRYVETVAAPVIQSTKEATAALREQQAVMREGMAVFDQTRTPIEALAIEQQHLSELLRKGAIDANTWSRANSQAVAQTANAYLGLASDAAGALATLFGESKGFAIAQAVINTAQAVTATLAQYGATPWGLAAAGVAAAAGAAQIATIASASKGGGGGGGGGSSSVGSSAGAGSAAAAPQAAGASQGIFIESIGDDELFTGERVKGLIAAINEQVKDGATLVTG